MAEAADARCEAAVVDRVKPVTRAQSTLAKRRRDMRLRRALIRSMKFAETSTACGVTRCP
jgi:hypothetical protein